MGKRKIGLKLHTRGMWYVKVAGKFYYFGKDRETAEKRWQDEGPYILGGLAVPSRGGGGSLSLIDLIAKYDVYCQDALTAGHIGQRHLNGIRSTLANLVRIAGENSRPDQWTPATFQTIRDGLATPIPRQQKNGKHRGLVGTSVKVRNQGTIAGDIRRIKAFLNWAASGDQKLIGQPQFGKSFTVARKVLRKLKAAKGRQDMPACDIRKVLDECSVQFRPIVLLGINAGIGARDISLIETRSMPSGQFWSMARNKTGAMRRFWLWPETKQAIADYIDHQKQLKINGRGKCKRLEWECLLFRTAQGNAWVTEGDGKCKDSIGWYFGRLTRRVGVRGSFYDLRRTFETVAGETLDQMAVNLVMGHVPSADDMASIYVQNISTDRIRTVCEHVRSWLYE